MVWLTFYLFGKDKTNPDNLHSVEIDVTQDFEAVKSHVADSFSIVDPSGVGFQTTTDSRSITDLDALLDIDEHIAVTVDGHAVRKVPGPKGLPIVGSYYEVYPDHLGNIQRLFDSYGSVIQHTSMGKTTFLTNSPEVAAHVFQETPFWSKLIEGEHPLVSAKDNSAGLFFSDTNTESWRLAHKFLAPALSPKATRHYTPLTQRAAEETFSVFDGFANDNEAFQVFDYMFKLTSQAVCKLVLDLDLHHFDHADAPLGGFVTTLIELTSLLKKVAEQGSWYSHLPFGNPKKLRTIKSSFLDACVEAMKVAQSEGGPDLPIATAALEARSIADYAARAVDEDGQKLSPEHAAGALPIIIGAGFITSASLLSWMINNVVTHPETQDKLLQELIDHGVTADTQWNYDTTNELHYLDSFIKETQRLCNPAFQPARTALRDQIIPGGYEIPKGATMICSLHAIHRNSTVWDDPTTFSPDRWDTEKVRKRPTGAYVPFAMGPRSCIGFNFALQEVKTMFATLLYRYEFIKYGDEVVQYDQTSITYKPLNLFVQLRLRTQWPEKSQ